MKAIVQNAYGSTDALSLKEIPKPSLKDDEALIKVHASAVNAGDGFSLMGTPMMVKFMVGFPKPKDYILGWDVAGTVEEVGKGVKNLKKGDRVFTATNAAFAEYTAEEACKVAKIPKGMSFTDAAALPTAGLTALQELKNLCQVKKGQKVLITGASGGVGHMAVQIAKELGAEVTGVCSTKNVAMVKELGADHVIDYKKTDFTKGMERYDHILDNVAKNKISGMRKVLTPTGKLQPNSGHGGMTYVISAFALGMISKQVGTMKVTETNTADLDYLAQLYQEGKLKPVIVKTYPLEDTPKAIGELVKGHSGGKIVIIIVE